MELDYSIDMIRLGVDYKEKVMLNWFKSFELDTGVTYYESNKINSYKHNYVIETEFESTIYIGFHQNAEKKDEKTVVIEFNPNKIDILKVKNNTIHKFLTYGFNSLRNENIALYKLFIKSFDIAVDIPKHIDEILFINNKRHEGYVKEKSKTYYFGKRGKNGYVKLYDKGFENGSNEDLTRYEVTYKINTLYNDVTSILKAITSNRDIDLFLKHNDYSDLSETMKVHLFAYENGYNINDMSRKYKKKLKEILEEKQKKISIDKTRILHTYWDYIDLLEQHYINNNILNNTSYSEKKQVEAFAEWQNKWLEDKIM